MTTQHTPGPWLVTAAGFDEDMDTGEATYVIAAPSGMELSLANARLIAAAPELLEALEDLCSYDTPRTQDKWDNARDAIAKAKGEA